jgi:hypothetical protein
MYMSYGTRLYPSGRIPAKSNGMGFWKSALLFTTEQSDLEQGVVILYGRMRIWYDTDYGKQLSYNQTVNNKTNSRKERLV